MLLSQREMRLTVSRGTAPIDSHMLSWRPRAKPRVAIRSRHHTIPGSACSGPQGRGKAKR